MGCLRDLHEVLLAVRRLHTAIPRYETASVYVGLHAAPRSLYAPDFAIDLTADWRPYAAIPEGSHASDGRILYDTVRKRGQTRLAPWDDGGMHRAGTNIYAVGVGAQPYFE